MPLLHEGDTLSARQVLELVDKLLLDEASLDRLLRLYQLCYRSDRRP